MACTEFQKAIDWSKKSTNHELYPVIAYFTKHYGSATSTSRDYVHYASGPVLAYDTPAPHLEGTLKGAVNSEKDGEMNKSSSLTYDVKVWPNGKLSYHQMSNGQPVGGMPPTVVQQATCVNNVLLTATTGSEVVTVGVVRKPSVFVG